MGTDNLERINSLKKSIGSVYLGDWLIDLYNNSELRKMIHERADQELHTFLLNKRAIVNYDKVIFLSMIYIALEEYDSSFWKHLVKYYPKSYTEFNSQLIHNSLRDIIRYEYGEAEEGQRLINHILMEAFVPINYLEGFFDFMFDILKYNYDYFIFDDEEESSIEELYEEILGVFEYIFSEEQDKSENENYQLFVDNSYKDYKLIKSTRMVLSNREKTEALVPLIVNVLRILEASFFDQEVSRLLENSYLKKGYEKWKLNRFKLHANQRVKDRKKSERDVLKPRIFRYESNSKSILLKTRRHNITNYNSGDKFSIKILTDGVQTYSLDSLSIRNAIGGVRIESKIIELEDFFGNLEYRLYRNKELIYSSKNTLTFHHLFFDNRGDILKNTDYEGNVFLLTNKKLTNSTLNMQPLKSGYVYTGYKDKNTQLDFGDEIITFGEVRKNELIGEKNELVKCLWKENKTLDSYKKINSIIISCENTDPSRVYLRVNSENKKLSKENKKNLRQEEEKLLEIDLSFLDLEPSYYKIEVVEGNENIICSFDLILDRNFGVEETNSVSRQGVLKQELYSSFFEDVIVEQSRENLLTQPIEELKVSFESLNHLISYEKIITIPHWEYNDKKYYYQHKTWLPDLSTSLQIIQPNIEKYYFTDYFGNKIREAIGCNNANQIVLNFPEINGTILSNKLSGMIINVFANKKVYKYYVMVSNHLLSDKNKIFTQNDDFYLDLAFEGKNKLSVEVSQDGIRVYYDRFDESQIVKLPIQHDIKYSITISEGENNPFSRVQLKTLKKAYYKHFSEAALLEFTYRVEEVFLEEEDDSGIFVSRTFITNLRKEEGVIVGDICYETMYGDRIYMNRINPITLEFLEETKGDSVNDRITIMVYAVDNGLDGLLFNIRRKQVSSTGEEINLPSIDRIKLTLMKEKSNV